MPEPHVNPRTIRVPLPEQILGGRYKLLERIGSGGMGLVFLAEQVNVGNRVAVKVLDPEPTVDEESRIARFLQEGRVSIEVSHPGAAQLLDIGRDPQQGFLYIVFEYVEGFDLRQVLRDEGRLDFDEARTITLKIAEALAFAHARGIVHRDIKPENIRMRRDLAGPHVKVLDFGIARLMRDQGFRLTADGELAGTPRYMAPEQIRDAPIDARTDVYALGLVLYEMLAGRPAYDGKNMSQILMKQVQDPIPKLMGELTGLKNPAIDQFLAKACAKRSDERFQSMADLARALTQLQVGPWPQLRDEAQSKKGLSDTFVRDPGMAVPTEAALQKPTALARHHEPPSQKEKSAPPQGAARPATVLPDNDTSSHKQVAKGLPPDLLATDPDRPAVARAAAGRSAPVSGRAPLPPPVPSPPKPPVASPGVAAPKTASPNPGSGTLVNSDLVRMLRPRRWPWVVALALIALAVAIGLWRFGVIELPPGVPSTLPR